MCVYSFERLICYQEYNQTTFLGLFRARMKREEFSNFFDQNHELLATLKLFKSLSRLYPDLQTRVMFLAAKRILQPMHINVKFLILYQCDEYTI